MKKCQLFIIPVCFLFFQTVWSQDDSQRQRDSLLQVIKTAQGKEKLDAYAGLTTQVVYTEEQADTLFMYFKSAIQEAKKQGDRQQEAQFKTNYITYLYNYDRRKELMKTAPDFLSFLAENNKWEQYYAMYELLLETFLNECWFETAIKEAKLLYDKASQQNHPAGISGATFIIGVAYQKLERYGDAEKYFRETIAIQNKAGLETPLLFDTYFVLSEVLLEQKRYSEAMKTAKELGNLVDNKEKKDNRVYPVSRYSLYLIQAMIFLEMGEFEKADSFLDSAEKQLPDIERALINIYYHRARIAELRKEYHLALKLCDEAYRLCETAEEYSFSGDIIKVKYRALSKMQEKDELLNLFEQYTAIKDSVEQQRFHAQIDEFRTQYEVDRHIAEKIRNRNYFLSALGGCILLAIALGIWIYYSRTIVRKNRGLYRQIKEQDRLAEELEAMTKQYEQITQLAPIVADDNVAEVESVILPGTKQQRLLISNLREYLLKDKYFARFDIDTQELVPELATNRTYLYEALKAVVGKTPMEYVNSLRMDEAKRLLEQSDLTIETIAEECGFNTSRTFYRQFRDRYRITPAEYRKIAENQ